MGFDKSVFTYIHHYSIMKSIFTAITTFYDPFIDPPTPFTQHSAITNLLVSSSVQFSHSVVSNSLWSHGLQHARLCLSINYSWSLCKLMSIESVMPSNNLFLCCPLLLLPSNFPSIRVFSNELVIHIGWPKYWSFNFNIKSFQLIFRTDFL